MPGKGERKGGKGMKKEMKKKSMNNPSVNSCLRP